ncbi:hypothetical protein DNTS_023096 [Danionella cerebrum]|uniref:Uncharacterized protein n=1 Tax=Danionella cerebrum TaxID=2873325 RepID=A0A553QSN0_9TELE|nr:hypothetical protein DNTS_023096 [Danionella translucida]
MITVDQSLRANSRASSALAFQQYAPGARVYLMGEYLGKSHTAFMITPCCTALSNHSQPWAVCPAPAQTEAPPRSLPPLSTWLPYHHRFLIAKPAKTGLN